MRLGVLSLIALLIPSAAAQANETHSLLDPELAPWIESRNHFDAGMLAFAAGLGVAGVAIATLRTQTPATGGSAKLRKRELLLQEEEAAFRKMWTDGKSDADAQSQDIAGYLTQKRKDLEADKRRLVRNTGILHAFIGIGLALLFAQDVYQALVFGAGGPAILASILSRQQQKYALDEKTEALEAARAILPHDAPQSPGSTQPAVQNAKALKEQRESLTHKLRLAAKL